MAIRRFEGQSEDWVIGFVEGIRYVNDSALYIVAFGKDWVDVEDEDAVDYDNQEDKP